MAIHFGDFCTRFCDRYYLSIRGRVLTFGLTSSPNGDNFIRMETNSTAIVTAATNHNILLGIVKHDTTKNAVARKAGIPMTTFDRKINGRSDFTLRELGAVAEALGLGLADILPVELLSHRDAA